jgi:hypothetical protein
MIVRLVYTIKVSVITDTVGFFQVLKDMQEMFYPGSRVAEALSLEPGYRNV